MTQRFAGFSKAGLTFLRGLEKNNERDWFNARKETFNADVSEPFDRFIAGLAGRLHTMRIPLAPKPRNPAFRIYRDVRFSADKRPYKTWVSTAFYRAGDSARAGVLYVQLSPRESFAAAGFYRPDALALAALRSAVVRDVEGFLKTSTFAGAALLLDDTLARMPRDFKDATGTPIEAHVKLKSFAVRRILASTSLSSARLVDDVANFAAQAYPFLSWGWKALGEKP